MRNSVLYKKPPEITHLGGKKRISLERLYKPSVILMYSATPAINSLLVSLPVLRLTVFPKYSWTMSMHPFLSHTSFIACRMHRSTFDEVELCFWAIYGYNSLVIEGSLFSSMQY